MEVQVEVGPENAGLSEVRLSMLWKDYFRHFDQRLMTAAKQAHLPGFRPGKVPASIIKKHYGDAIKQDVLEDILRKGLSEASTKSTLRIVGVAKFDTKELDSQVVSAQDDSTLQMTMSLAVVPEPEIKNYKGLELTFAQEDFDESKVDEEIGHRIWDHLPCKPVEGREEAQKGDRATLNFYKATEPGNEAGDDEGEETQIARPLEFTIGGSEKRCPRELQDLVVGMKVGETRIWPGNGEEREDIRVKLAELKEELPLKITDEFVKEKGWAETAAEWKALVEDEIKKGTEAKNKNTRETALFDALVDNNPFEIHNMLIEEELRNDLYRMGIIDPRDKRMQNLDLSKFKGLSGFVPQTEKKVRLTIILKQLVAQLGMEPTEEQYEKFFEDLVKDREFKTVEAAKEALGYPDNKIQARFFVAQDELVTKLLELSTHKLPLATESA